jgi:hypothetical protein
MPFYTELGFLVFSEGEPTQKFLINLESVGQVTTEASKRTNNAPPRFLRKIKIPLLLEYLGGTLQKYPRINEGDILPNPYPPCFFSPQKHLPRLPFPK